MKGTGPDHSLQYWYYQSTVSYITIMHYHNAYYIVVWNRVYECYINFDYIGIHDDTPTACEGITTLSETPGMLRLTQEFNPKYYAAALYDLHYMTVQCLSRVVIGASSADCRGLLPMGRILPEF